MEILAIPYIVAFGLVVWWASVWGRSVFWAVIGCLVLSPLIWGIVLLILGPDRAEVWTGESLSGESRPGAGPPDARGD